MWDSTIRFYENDATQIGVYGEAARWLGDHLDDDEHVFLPMKDVFWTFEPSLKTKTIEYIEIWDSLDYKLRIITTDEEIQHVRDTMVDYVLNDENNVKYMVFSWNDQHAKIATGINHIELTKETVCQKFHNSLSQVNRIEFTLPHSNWGNSLVICEVNK